MQLALLGFRIVARDPQAEQIRVEIPRPRIIRDDEREVVEAVRLEGARAFAPQRPATRLKRRRSTKGAESGRAG